MAGGCSREPREPGGNDTAAPDTTAIRVDSLGAPAPPVSTNGWRLEEAGPALVVPDAASLLRARLVFPQYTDSTLTAQAPFDLAPLRSATLELFAPAGLVGRATLADVAPPVPAAGSGGSADGVGPAPAACAEWPSARLVPATEPLSPWRAAFVAGHARAIPLDSATALTGPDSARLAADVARLASALPQDTASAFRGLPFVVRDVRRFTPVAGTDALVADVVRRVNQEASQQMEHLVLVAERVAGRPSAPWTVGYVERASGEEETLEMAEVLAAVALGPARRPTLVVVRDFGDGGTAYALVERVERGRWVVRWSSAYAGC